MALLLSSTLAQPFEVVPGMPQLFSQWANTLGVKVPDFGKSPPSFHYVSGSPIPIYPIVDDFLSQNFPPGSIHLKNFSLWDGSMINSLTKGRVKHTMLHKTIEITSLLRQFPERKFILVGDSGEADPETFAQIYDEHKKQIKCIFIRLVPIPPTTLRQTPEFINSVERFSIVFRRLPGIKWYTFRSADELMDMDLSRGCRPIPARQRWYHRLLLRLRSIWERLSGQNFTVHRLRFRSRV